MVGKVFDGNLLVGFFDGDGMSAKARNSSLLDKGNNLLKTTLLAIGFALVGVGATGDEAPPETEAAPLTARWTGAAGNSDLADFGNWACFDADGAKIVDTLPTASTAVTLFGNLAIDIPAGTAFQYATLSFDNCTFTADCDWRGLDLMRIGDGGVVDLNGHSLALSLAATPTNSVTFTDSTAEPAQAGTLRIEVPAGVTVQAGTCRFTGTLKLAKEGAGALELPNGTAYAETGETTVVAGLVKFTGTTELAAGTGALLATNSMPTIDLNGQTVAVGALYDQGTLVNNAADLATVVLGRGNADTTLGFIPPANVQVRKEGTGTLTVDGPFAGKLNIAQGAVVCRKQVLAFRHYRFVVLRPWGSTANSMQFSEFKLLDGETDVTPLRSGLSYTGGVPDISESQMPPTVVDGDLTTKYLDRRCAGNRYAENKGSVYVQLDYDAPQPITGYNWATANDRPNNWGSDERDPADWLLMGSDDGETWITLDKRTGYYATTARMTWVGPFILPSGGAGLANVTSESADTSLTLDDVNLTAQGLRVGSLDLVHGGTLTIPRYEWFRFSIKKVEGGRVVDGGDQMQISELALYDAAGKRVNLGLTLGSSATALNPGEMFPSHSVHETHVPKNLFDGDTGTKWFVGGNTPSPSNPTTWLVVTMRLAADAASVVGYNFATGGDSASWFARNPTVWSLEGSADGVNWVTVDERSVSQGPHANGAWYDSATPYKVFDALAAAVAGSGEIVKTGGGEAMFQGTFTGGVGLRIAAGRFTAIPELSRCKWYRFSIKQVEKDNQMQLSELALYDAAGNRVNLDLALGSSAAALSAGQMFVSPSGHPTNVAKHLFDGNMDTKWVVGDNAPSPLNPATWEVVTMRLADDAAPVASYNFATGGDSASWWARNPTKWMLETSADGVNWLVVDERAVSQGPHANKAWYNGGSPYAVNGGAVAAPESAALGKVSVAAGAELNLSVAVPVKGLEVDAAGAGRISKLELAPGGVIDIVNAIADDFRTSDVNYRVPLAIGELSGSANDWRVRVNGEDINRLKLRKVGNALYIRPNVFMVIIR